MEKKLFKRRDFIGNVVKAGAAGVMVTPIYHHFTTNESLTVAQVIERIIAEVPGGKLNETVDTLKSGSGEQVVTGIVTTMFATVKVIQAAVKIKANFIIAHEPTFYNHADDLNWIENNTTAKEKKELLDKYQITVWRFHDYWHRMKPDGILHGFLSKTGWLAYNPKEENVFQLPAQTFIEILRHIKDSLKIPHIRYIGDESANCSIIALMPGAAGGQRQLKMLIENKADLLIVGESPEWETPEYIRDSRALGKPVSLIVLGHAYSEEPGMEYLVQWLQPKLPGIKITHISTEATYTWA
ncbi:MAG TPA: Nif3-like dinuclear metal center hexameric protein [Puia sp.]|jgi:putative NIF3 family GTP cyclohydrolase 1 type 2